MALRRLDVGDSNWPVALACAMVIGFVALVSFRDAPALLNAKNKLDDLLNWRGNLSATPDRQALVITTNSRDQLIAVATLSPRGFQPLLAANARQVRAHLRADSGTLGLAVVDATLPDYPSISRALKEKLPSTGIIVLSRSHRSEDVVPMLLDRLCRLSSHPNCKAPPGRHGASQVVFDVTRDLITLQPDRTLVSRGRQLSQETEHIERPAVERLDQPVPAPFVFGAVDADQFQVR